MSSFMKKVVGKWVLFLCFLGFHKLEDENACTLRCSRDGCQYFNCIGLKGLAALHKLWRKLGYKKHIHEWEYPLRDDDKDHHPFSKIGVGRRICKDESCKEEQILMISRFGVPSQWRTINRTEELP